MTGNEFKLSGEICYLNHAAVSPWPRRTVEAVKKFADENGFTGAQHYENWLATEQHLRQQLKRLVNASSTDEIALLKNTSEALSVVAYGMNWSAGDEIIISSREFPSNRIVWESLQTQGVRVVQADITATPEPEQAIVDAVTSNTRLISVSSVQYSTGLSLNLPVIGSACRDKGIAFCIDAIQSLGALPLDVQACHADFVMADGHKWMLGPEGVAVFYCRDEWIRRLSLKQYGWHMVEALGDYERTDWQAAESARRFECGSPNMLGIHALDASLSLILEIGIHKIADSISAKIQFLIDNISHSNGIILSAAKPEQRAGIVTFRFPHDDPEARYRHLQRNGVICALRGGGIRFSPHFYTAESTLQRALDVTLHTQ